ncbi:UPF0692 protein C19orf54 homolog [Stegodyphus dumicola]|uniref:UPF0692 protein C19orf54 homolog n=1 Tax=Stegodyphus dumicola TaxID=202533 RepID=UPI0015ABDEB2|nr:UPF0692 protein C19orf54 homolog [Stegodyphus dumicola]XP_035230431.1 UPF0692 protein C19orf54 homolog [Stegodyphus dumicola]XP_035230432.1 UPF0692 protein C19orf54 homolog [Stegodyphus dumicola]XP_035230433.1 UPF0692 protein C19orf54 homolog [Stegodyphus dumicola]XP_035230434.1 UPF0692 protein C19orf54 homolog [Stegodyphus dumicola]XP_035230435.1 UPF0692 protein C19orf54 homolog [Stegodyphus dumicola]XP_035230437.1 UPF0692 protein C19orf54 homolog [Stegodyphus dumicola]XP_035230438.1 UPF
MENKVSKESCVSPPLPPPPPPPQVPYRKTDSTNLNDTDSKSNCKMSNECIISAVRHLFSDEKLTALISFCKPTIPIIQEGRCCGIVALSMASQFIQSAPVQVILEKAKALNFTKEGELFSAYNMATLASDLLHCDASVVDDVLVHKKDILHHICEGWPVLIPYDSDKNHFPCSNKGHSAHWAVITGLCFSVSEKLDLHSLPYVQKFNDFPELSLIISKNGSYVKTLLDYAERIFVYARQGKSKHLAAWDLNELLASNNNLFEVTKKYSSDQLVLPKSGLSELRDKAVLLKMRES